MDAFACLNDPSSRIHFVGLAGTGVSALAQYLAFGGHRVSGSDRSFDRGVAAAEREILLRDGIAVLPQDGSGAGGAALVVASGAVEAAVPDVARARELGVAVASRAELLAHLVAERPSVGVAGTSGKSTVTALIFEILRAAGRDPGLITGGRLLSLMAEGRLGNAARGGGPLVFEADESDGSLVRHRPTCGVVLNLHRDHMEPARVLQQFQAFRRHVRGPFVVADEPELSSLWADVEGVAKSLRFGLGGGEGCRGELVELQPRGSRVRIVGAEDVEISMPHPGEHNARNALAAFAAARALDVDPAVAAAAIARFSGVFRRFQKVGERDGVEIVDDFAHNPAKLAATLRAAQLHGRRVLAYFQPHGYAPLRFQRDDLVKSVSAVLRKDDVLFVAPVYYAGGTVDPDVRSEDVVAAMRARGADVRDCPRREDFVQAIREEARPGDIVLVLGARDPTLHEFARGLTE